MPARGGILGSRGHALGCYQGGRPCHPIPALLPHRELGDGLLHVPPALAPPSDDPAGAAAGPGRCRRRLRRRRSGSRIVPQRRARPELLVRIPLEHVAAPVGAPISGGVVVVRRGWRPRPRRHGGTAAVPAGLGGCQVAAAAIPAYLPLALPCVRARGGREGWECDGNWEWNVYILAFWLRAPEVPEATIVRHRGY